MAEALPRTIARATDLEEPPKISVVVATRDRVERVARLLGSLRAQTLSPRQFEVVVVNDGSRDRTAELLREEGARGELRLTWVSRSTSGGPAVARDLGWRRSAAARVAFTDDDCVASETWLENLLEAFERHPDAIIQGRTDPDPAELDRIGLFSRTVSVTELGPHYQTCNIAYPREWLIRLDGFDRSFRRAGEDSDLAWRALEGGAEVSFAADARVYHAVNDLGPLGALRSALRWSDAMAAIGRHPGLRRLDLRYGIFWRRSHALLTLAVIGLVVGRRFPIASALVLPYARQAIQRARTYDAPDAMALYCLLLDLVETSATLSGAIRHRVLVI